MAIVELPDFVAYLGSEIAANQQTIAASLAGAEFALNHHCHRKFVIAAAPATVRVFTPAGCSVLFVDDIATTTDLVITDNGTAVAATDYQLEPLNGLDEAGVAVPYTHIWRTTGAWYQYRNKASVSVTARWGWTAFPPDVTEACRVLAKDMVSMRDTRFGVAGWGEFGVVRMRENPQVLSLLAPYVRNRKVFAF